MRPLQPTLDDLRAEFRDNDVRGWLWPWILDLLVAYAATRIRNRYRAQTYSPSGDWGDSTLGDLANEFIVRKGIEKGGIARALLVAVDLPSLGAYLKRSFKRFVIDERPRSLSRNLFDRLRDVLDGEPDFIRLGGVPPQSQYGLADWEQDPPRLASDDIIVVGHRYLPNDVKWVTYGQGSRESPGISSRDLARIVRSLFEGTGRLLTARQVMEILKQRYVLRDEAVGSDVANSTVAPNDNNPLERVEAEDLAKRAFDAFTLRQRDIVRLMLEDPIVISARDLASRLDISKSTAATELQAIQARFRLLGADAEVIQRQILDALAPLLKAG